MAEPGKSRVDEIWKQLNCGVLKPQSNASFNKLWHTLNTDPSLRTDGRRAPPSGLLGAKPAQQNRPPTVTTQPGLSGTEGTTAGQGKAAVPDSKPAPPTMSLQRAVAQLQDPSAARRKEALVTIRAHALDSWPAASELQDMLEGDVGKAVLKRFDDKGEACRERAVELYCSMLKACPDAILAVLPYVMPVLEERLQHEQGQALVEPCEEIRLQLAQLLLLVINTAGKAIGAYAAEAVLLADSGALDSFYEVNIVCCSIVAALNGILGLHLQSMAKQLVATFLPLTTHNRYKVRIAAIQAVRVTMFQNAHEMILETVAFRDPNVVPIKAFYGDDLKVNFCGKLSTDSHPQVRREFLDMVGDWLLHLPERQDHEQRLLPYVLSAVADPHPDNAVAALKLLHELGELHIKDKGKELEDTLRYLPEEAHALGWSIAEVEKYVYSRASISLQSTAGTSNASIIPAPFTSRPSLGTRMIVQANFGRTCPALAAELTTWVQELRLRAAQLLRVSLVFLEDHVSNHLHILLPVLIKVVNEPELGPAVEECLGLMGCFLSPDAWLRHLMPGLEDSSADAAMRSCYLAATAALVRGAIPATSGHLKPLGTILLLPANIKTEDARVKKALERLLRALLDHHPTVCLDLEHGLLLALLYLGSNPHGSNEDACRLATGAKQMADKLAASTPEGSLDSMLHRHAEALIAQVVEDRTGHHSSMDLAALSLLLAPLACMAGAASSDLSTTTQAWRQEEAALGLSDQPLQGLCSFVQQALPEKPAKAAITAFLGAFIGSLGVTPAASIIQCGSSLSSLTAVLCAEADEHVVQLGLACLTVFVQQCNTARYAGQDNTAQLATTAASCLQSSSATVRHQACKALDAIVASSWFTHASESKGNVVSLCEAVLERCYDANEDVQVASVKLLEGILERLASPACGTKAADSTDYHKELLLRIQAHHAQWGVGAVEVHAARLLKRFSMSVPM